MEDKNIKTLTGLTLDQLVVKLDEELPEDAYTQVPGSDDFTDIDPNHMKRVLNEIFGLCGFGWGYRYASHDLTLSYVKRKTASGEKEWAYAVLRKLEFWYRLVVGENIELCVIHASGASDNCNGGYALKGALTNAIGNASSSIGFQQSVYLGVRSHKTVGKKSAGITTASMTSATTITPKTTSTTSVVAGKPASAPVAAKPMAIPSLATSASTVEASATEGQENANPAEYIVPIGTKKGAKLGTLTRVDLEFFSTIKPGAHPQAQKLKDMATQLINELGIAAPK